VLTSSSIHLGVTLLECAAVQARRKPRRGRPRHLDPPKLLATNLPTTAYDLLGDLAAALRRTKGQILAEAIQAYAAKHADVLPRRKR
jgi:hypothetical protein